MRNISIPEPRFLGLSTISSSAMPEKRLHSCSILYSPQSRNRRLMPVFCLLLMLTAPAAGLLAADGAAETVQKPASSGVSEQPFNEELAQKAFESAIRPETVQERTFYPAQNERSAVLTVAFKFRTFYPAQNEPQALADRFMALLPPELRDKTSCKVDETTRTLTILGPPQVTATADKLIPRMDSNLQLSGPMVDYGLADAANDSASSPFISEAPAAEKPSPAYYDPNENRMVRTLSEPKNAILPQSDAQRGMTVLGSDQAAAPQGEAAAQTPDIVLYYCPPERIAVSVAQLKQAFAPFAEVTITSDVQEGKILVYTTKQRHAEVRRFLAGLGIQPMPNDAVPFGETAAAGSAPVRADNLSAPSAIIPSNTTGRVNAAPVQTANTASPVDLLSNASAQPVRQDFTPVYKNLSVIESELTNLLQTRLERIFPKDPNDPQLSPADREKTIWRFTRRIRPNTNEEAPQCQLFFNPREQRLTITGSPRLVSQMKTLVESLDNSGRTGASHPRYIMLKNADPNQIQEIFDVQKRQMPNTQTQSPLGSGLLSPNSIIRGQMAYPQTGSDRASVPAEEPLNLKLGPASLSKWISQPKPAMLEADKTAYNAADNEAENSADSIADSTVDNTADNIASSDSAAAAEPFMTADGYSSAAQPAIQYDVQTDIRYDVPDSSLHSAQTDIQYDVQNVRQDDQSEQYGQAGQYDQSEQYGQAEPYTQYDVQDAPADAQPDQTAVSEPMTDSAETVSAAGMQNSPIRPVNWQDDSLGALGNSAPIAAPFDATVPGPAGPGQIDLVPDFVPMVLPDLDMVILDAPEAESKRIIEMIDKIEQLAGEAEPQTELYYLKHVNSVMLGGVLAKLYAEMFSTKQGRVLVYAMQYPNAILLVGWGEAPKAMKTLIEMFDQPIQDGNNMIEVVSLKYASAQEIATLLTSQFPTPTPESGGLAPRIRVIPDPRTNSLVIQAAPNDFSEIQKLLMKLDVNTSEAKLEVRTFPLKHSLASDIRTSITQAILPAMQGTLPAAEAKYPILQIMTVDAESRKLIESGIMRDVQVSADVQNNQLIVTAPSDCMELMAQLIEMLDVAPAKAQIKIFPLRFADAVQIQKTLQSLLPAGGGAMPAIPNAEGESSFVPVRFALDTRMNCILVAASPLDLKIIDSLIIALDRKDSSQRREEVIQLRNVQATAIAQAINVYLNQKQQLELSSGSVSDYQLFDSQVIVVPETSTNSIIISATPKYLEEISKLVKSFDAEPASVVIQVLIAEVTLSDDEEFGIEAGLQDKIAFDRSLVTSVTNGTAEANPGYEIIKNNSQGNNYWAETDPASLAGTAVSSLGMGRTNSDLGYGGLVLSASSNSIQVLLRALREKNRLQILSRPEIRAMDNQQAFILIGQRVPRIAGASSTNYGVTSNVTEANVGLILLVTPKIDNDGRVIMEIGAEKSSLGSASDAIPVYTSGDQTIKSPTIDTTQVMTAVSAVNGETVMLGGLITNQKTKVSRGVPFVSDIPVVGWLFRYDKAAEERKELIIVMTPRVITNRNDSERIKRVEASKMSWCLADAMAINGSMGLYNPLGATNNVPAQTQTLPFLEMDKMEQIPPSAIKPYSPDNDYPDSTPDNMMENNPPVLNGSDAVNDKNGGQSSDKNSDKNSDKK